MLKKFVLTFFTLMISLSAYSFADETKGCPEGQILDEATQECVEKPAEE